MSVSLKSTLTQRVVTGNSFFKLEADFKCENQFGFTFKMNSYLLFVFFFFYSFKLFGVPTKEALVLQETFGILHFLMNDVC